MKKIIALITAVALLSMIGLPLSLVLLRMQRIHQKAV